jgi:hypothetical protein
LSIYHIKKNFEKFLLLFLQKGEQARGFFLKSELATNVLAQIWNLADCDKDGKLDKKEFSIACYLIKKVLTSPKGPSILPATTPSSLLIEPPLNTTITAPILPITSMPTAPLISQVPLFQPTFPQMPSTILPNNNIPSSTPLMNTGVGGVSLFPNINALNPMPGVNNSVNTINL